MTPERFVRDRPCLDEIEGFKRGAAHQGISFSSEEIAPLLRWEADLRAGRDLPARPKGPDHTWIYKKGSSPVRKRGELFSWNNSLRPQGSDETS